MNAPSSATARVQRQRRFRDFGVLASGKPLGLASHNPLTVKRSLVGGEQRLELTGFSPDRLDWYKNKGCFTEIIRYRTRLFVPVSRAGQILPSIAIGH